MRVIDAVTRDGAVQGGLGWRESDWNQQVNVTHNRTARRLRLRRGTGLAPGNGLALRRLSAEKAVRVLELHRQTVEPRIGESDVHAIVASVPAGERRPRSRRQAERQGA